jgi:glyoxylase-like metal-dependent hydrolase (beta-lactamase superfamily II)
VGGVVDLLKHQNVPVLGPQKEDDFWIQQLPEITKAYQFPISPSFTPNQWLEEGDTLQVGNEIVRVIYVPGHTPGHVVFYSESAQLLIAGDVLFRESIGRTDFPRGNHADLIGNIKGKLWKLPDETQVVTGHGPMTSIGYEKANNPFLR